MLFISAVVREDRSILDFIDGRFTYLNGSLARYYGITGVDGEKFQRVVLDGNERSGIVTQGSILTISSYATRTSPVLRGKWVLRQSARRGAAASARQHSAIAGKRSRHGRLDARAAGAASRRIPAVRSATIRWIRSGSPWRTTMPRARGG